MEWENELEWDRKSSRTGLNGNRGILLYTIPCVFLARLVEKTGFLAIRS